MSVSKLVRAALIAAVYVALCVVLSPISYGPVQVRVAEALTLLPVICAEAVPGVALGCFIANLFTGSVPDIIIGTLTTLAAAVCTRALRNIRFKNVPFLAAVPPVLFNAVAIGAMLTWLYFPAGSGAGVWLFNMLTVGLGQLASCVVLGLPMVWAIERRPRLLEVMGGARAKPENTQQKTPGG